jgi:hypothetical protein
MKTNNFKNPRQLLETATHRRWIDADVQSTASVISIAIDYDVDDNDDGDDGEEEDDWDCDPWRNENVGTGDGGAPTTMRAVVVRRSMPDPSDVLERVPDPTCPRRFHRGSQRQPNQPKHQPEQQPVHQPKHQPEHQPENQHQCPR